MMTQRFFKVAYDSGCFIDCVLYAKDEIVEMDIPANAKIPMWAIEVDEDGRALSAPNTSNPLDSLSDSLARRIAGVTEKQTAHPMELTDEQKAQVEQTLSLLDHENDSHWTARKQPNTEVISAIVGFPVTRKELNEIAPDFVRIVTE